MMYICLLYVFLPPLSFLSILSAFIHCVNSFCLLLIESFLPPSSLICLFSFVYLFMSSRPRSASSSHSHSHVSFHVDATATATAAETEMVDLKQKKKCTHIQYTNTVYVYS